MKKPEIIATSGDLPVCTIKGCGAIATAFLQVKLESGGRKIEKQSIGFCKKHAIEKHHQLLAGPRANYQSETFDKPNKLQ
jgi:hypothetical protein